MRRAVEIAADAAVAVLLLAGAPARAEEPQVTLFRVVDEGSLKVSGVRAASGAGASATVVILLEGARGEHLFLRRAPADGGGVLHFASMGGPTGVSFTRRGDGTLLEAGGRSVTVFEGDLARPTVACWVRALVARVDPKLLDTAAAVRLVKDATGGPALEDVYLPMSLLWPVSEGSDVRPKGRVTLEKGPFTGEDWERLKGIALGELGRR